MHAEIDKQGRLVVKPGTETEAYALAEWFKANWITSADQMRGERGHWRGSSVVLFAAAPSAPDAPTQRSNPHPQR